MATVNVYVPDEMKERLEGSGVNLSASARECWERDLAIAELPVGDVQVEAYDDDGPVELRFQGTLVSRSGVDGAELYLTDGDEVVYVPADEETYWTGPRSDFDDEDLLKVFGKDNEAYATAADVLGLKRIVQL